LTHDLMYNIFKSLRIELLEVFIYKFEDGAFFAELLLRQNNQEFRIDSRTSDAVAIALRTNSPIFTTESIMQNMAIVFDEKEVLANDFSNKDVSDIQEISKNIEEVRIDALQKRLEEAIKDEDYELATKLRDEINRRKSKEND